MAIDTLTGMRCYIDKDGEYHFISQGANPQPEWEPVGVMYPHMEQVVDLPQGHGWPEKRQ